MTTRFTTTPGFEGAALHTATSTALLAGLQDPANDVVWNDYVLRYRPLLVRYLKRLGVDAIDAEDVAQQTLVSFCTAYRAGKYDRDRGRLRSWLFGIATFQWRHYQRDRQREGRPREIASPDGFDGIEGENRLERIWEEEWADAVLRAALDEVRREVRPRTFEAFHLFVHQEWPAARVAAHLEITQNAVFGAKRRVMERLRAVLQQVEELF